MNATLTLEKIRTSRAATLGALLLAVLLLTLIPTSATAQVTRSITFDVPFDFVAGKSSLPAGTYVVSPLTHSTVLVRALDGGSATIVSTSASSADGALDSSELAFTRYGGVYVLAEVRQAASTEFRRVVPSKLALQLAKENAKGDVVRLAATATR